jgi:hypothetical protein
MENINGFLIKDYFLTGKVPYGQDFAPEERLSTAAIVADCLNAHAGILTVEMPFSVLETLAKISTEILKMHELDPPLPPTGKGFLEYARISGII